MTIDETIEVFISNDNSVIHPTLKRAVITAMGGNERFVKDYVSVADGGHKALMGLPIWLSEYGESIDFYNTNREHIKTALPELADAVGLKSGLELIETHSGLGKEFSLTLDDIAEAIFGDKENARDSSGARDEVVSWVNLVIGYEVCLNFDNFMTSQGFEDGIAPIAR